MVSGLEEPVASPFHDSNKNPAFGNASTILVSGLPAEIDVIVPLICDFFKLNAGTRMTSLIRG
jgi:hypothetical protein